MICDKKKKRKKEKKIIRWLKRVKLIFSRYIYPEGITSSHRGEILFFFTQQNTEINLGFNNLWL